MKRILLIISWQICRIIILIMVYAIFTYMFQYKEKRTIVAITIVTIITIFVLVATETGLRKIFNGNNNTKRTK